MTGGIYFIIAGTVIGIMTIIKPNFFWNHPKAAFVRRFLGDRWTTIFYLLASVAMLTIGIYFMTKINAGNKLDDAKEEQDTFEFPLDSSTTKTAIAKIIDKLDDKSALDFFDFYHPQLSDPGAYVTVHKENNQFKYQLANHGWTDDWKPIDKDSLTNYIYKNRQHNEGKIKLVARLKCTVDVLNKSGDTIVITPMFYKLADKNR